MIITVRDMLADMETGAVFSLRYVTYDRKRKTGGSIKEFPEARLVQSLKKETAARARTRNEEFELLRDRQADKPRDPNHREWYTRNLRIVQEGKDTSIIRKFHPPLVISYNGKTVVP